MNKRFQELPITSLTPRAVYSGARVTVVIFITIVAICVLSFVASLGSGPALIPRR